MIKLDFIILVLFLFLPASILLGTAVINVTTVTIAILTILSIFLKKNFLEYKNNILIRYVSLLILIFIICSILSDNISTSLLKSGSYTLYVFFLIGFLEVLKIYGDRFLYKLFVSLILTKSVLFISVIIQFFYNKFNFDLQYTGILNDQILGLFIIKILYITIGLFFHYKEKFKKTYFYLMLFYITFISFIMIILSQHKTSFILFLLGYFLIFIFDKKNRKSHFYILFLIIITIISFNLLFNNMIFEKIFLNIFNSIFNNQKIFFFSEHYTLHYISALKMFLTNPLTGIGPNLFRFECMNPEYLIEINSLSSCSTHPHNYYIQMLAEVGIFGFLMLLSLFFYIIKKIYYFRYKINDIYSLEYLTLISLFISLFPIAPTLNFFNAWSTTFIFFSLALYYYQSRLPK